MSGLSSRALVVIAVAAIILLGVVTGILIANQSQQNPKLPDVVMPAVTGTPSAQAKPQSGATADLASGVTQTVTAAAPAERAPVPQGFAENETGIAILPRIQLTGSRRYVLEISSRSGNLPFSGSYTRGSIDPKIAIDVMTEIKGTTAWEQEIQPPSPESRTWTLGVSLSTTLGKNIRVQVWDIGPR